MKKLFLLNSMLLSVLTCFSQNTDKNIRIAYDERGMIQSVSFRNYDGTIQIPESANAFFKEFLVIGQNDSFILKPEKSQSAESRHEHYDQCYKNINIEGAGYNFHYKNDKLYYANGYYVKIDSLNTIPSITSEKAIELYAKYKNIPLNSILESHSKLLIKEIYSSKESDRRPYLVYKVYVISNQIENDEYGIIDAHTGEVFFTKSSLISYSATGTFATRYNGSKQGITDYYNSNYHLTDYTRSAFIHTWNMQNSASLADSSELNDSDNNWTSAEHSSSENDMGLDVHWGIQQIHDYMLNNNQVDSWDNNGHSIRSFIRFGNSSYYRDNAFFDDVYFILKFGDGVTNFRPLASLDVVAHEYGHGITQMQIGWDYDDPTWPLAAFHEGLSDIWAVIMDYRLTSQQAWKIGEQIDLSYGCMRNIQDPNGPYNNARYDIADTYFSSIYNNGDAHIKGGVFSYMFYLLVNGGSGTNDLGNSYLVKGIGMDLAEDIIVRTVYNNYLDNIHSWQGIRENMVEATYDLINCNENYSSTLVNQVENAWYAVGVGQRPNQMYISGDWLLCFSSKSYTLQDPIPSSTIVWNCSSNITRISAQGSNPCNFQANSSGAGWIKATIYSQCDNIDIIYNVWAGKFENTIVTGTAAVCPNSVYTYTAQVPGGHQPGYSYSWTYPSNWYNYGQNQNSIILQTPYSPYYGTVRVSITNSCGTSGYSGITVYPKPYGCGGYFSMYPNPASDEVTIMLNKTTSVVTENPEATDIIVAKAISDDQVSYSIRVYSSMGTLVSTAIRTGTSFQIPLTNMRDGTYVVELSDGKNSYREQLIIKHD